MAETQSTKAQSTGAQITKSHAGDTISADKEPVFVVGSIIKIEHPSEDTYVVSQVFQQEHFEPTEKSGVLRDVQTIVSPAKFSGIVHSETLAFTLAITVVGEYLGEFKGSARTRSNIRIDNISSGNGTIYIWEKNPHEAWARVVFHPHRGTSTENEGKLTN